MKNKKAVRKTIITGIIIILSVFEINIKSFSLLSWVWPRSLYKAHCLNDSSAEVFDLNSRNYPLSW